LEGDGSLEVVAASDGVYAWHADGTLVAGWPQLVGSEWVSDPALADLDGDGGMEVIAGSGTDKVNAWRADGAPVEGWPQTVGGAVGVPPAVGDLEGDGEPEVVAGSEDGNVYVWRANGSPVAGWPQDAGSTAIKYPVLGDLDGDGRLEVVAGAGDGNVYAWHADGTPMAGWPQATGDAISGLPALGDLDGDQELEVVAGSWDGNVYAWHADGSLVAGWPQLTGPSPYGDGSWVIGSVALGDVDADGGLEAVVGAADGKVYVWHGNGALAAGWPQDTGGFSFGSPALGDLDGDGPLEVLIGVAHSGMTGWIAAWHADGTPVENFILDGGFWYYVTTSPALADLDADGKVELVIGLADGNTYAWRIDTATSDRVPWPMFHHDAQRTGLYVATATPGAGFSATPTGGPAPLTVRFTDQSTGHPISWAWDFGDGTTSTAQSPAHVYAAGGTFTVSLTVANALGTDTEVKPGFVTVAAALHADFAAAPASGMAPLLVSFTDLSAGDPTSWSWSFGDGGTSTVQHPGHTYTGAGSYTVSLTVANALGTDTEIKPSFVTVAAALHADFTAAPASGAAPLLVSFTDLSTGDPTSWSWDFNDGGVSTDQHPSHIYATPGRRTVSLTVSNSYGSDTETKSNHILVTFPDVDVGHWACDEILACVDAGIVTGYEDGTYHPEFQVTRDQMAVYIARGLVSPSGDAGIPDPEPPPSFPDVAPDFWAYKHIEYAVSQNVVKGYEDGTYQPDLTVDRGQMAVYVARAMVAPGGDAAVPDPVPPATFPDVADTFWAYKHIEYCVEHGVVQGYLDGYYHPEGAVTRDQMAVYVARAFALPM
jgi:PKD repeat protein